MSARRPRIGVLTGKGSRWHTGVLCAALRERGAEALAVPVTALRGRAGYPAPQAGRRAGPPRLGWQGPTGPTGGVPDEVALEECDAVVVRALPGGSLEQVIYRVDALHRLAALGTPVVNSAACIERAVDKFHALALLEGAGLTVPPTVVAERYDDAMAAFGELGGDVVLKPLFGSEGRGMVRLSDPDLAHRAFRALELGRGVYYLQRFVPHGDSDLRAFVLGDRVLAAMRRTGQTWKSNVAAGARAAPYAVTARIEELAVRAARAVGAVCAGVDLLPGEDGCLYAIEVNSIPGWQALQTTTALNIAGEIAGYVLRQAGQPGSGAPLA